MRLRSGMIGIVVLIFSFGFVQIREALSAVASEVAPIERVADKPVSIHVRRQPLHEVAAELEKQGSRRVVVDWSGFRPEPKISLDLEKVPFWQAVAEAGMAAKTPIDQTTEWFPEPRDEVKFWPIGFRCERYHAMDTMVVLERYERNPSGQRYVDLALFGYENEFRNEMFDVALKDSKSGRILSFLTSEAQAGYTAFKIPGNDVGHADTIDVELRATTASPLLKATVPMKLGARARGEGFNVTVTKIKLSNDPSAEVLLTRDDGRVDFHITDLWLLDAQNRSVPRGRTTYTYDTALKTRAEAWSNGLRGARKFVVTFGMDKKIKVSIKFPLPNQ
jgi:hypothetical protein